MSTLTTNLNLVKPDYTDYADINVINGNMDILDNEFSNLRNRYLPLTGGTLTGDLIGTNIKLSGRLTSTNTTGGMYINGGTSWGDGGSVYAYGKDHETNSGQLALFTNNGTDNARYSFYPDGNIAVSRNFALAAGKANSYYGVDGTIGLSNGSRTFELNANNRLYFNGGEIQLYNNSYTSYNSANISSVSTGNTIGQSQYAFEILQDKQTNMTDLYITIYNNGGNKSLYINTPVTFTNYRDCHITIGNGAYSSANWNWDGGDNMCTWVTGSKFGFFIRDQHTVTLHFHGRATLFNVSSANVLTIECDEEQTAVMNAQIELETINKNIQELQVASMCSTETATYDIVQDGTVVTVDDNELTELHTKLTSRRSELLEVIKNGQKNND